MRTMIIAPHPDDEILGVGGTLFRRKAEGAYLGWVIVTGMSVKAGWTQEQVDQRVDEIQKITDIVGFDEVFTLDYLATELDRVPMNELVSSMSKIFSSFRPNEIYLPHHSDVHTDHSVVFDATVSCTKWFRHPSINRVLAYETLSETDFSLRASQKFFPNVFVDVTKHLDSKLEAMDIYKSELGSFPFPRSHEAIRELATLRGSASGYIAAEAFELLRERS